MTSTISSAPPTLSLVASDTIVMVPAGTGLERAESIAILVLAAILILLIVFVIRVAIGLRDFDREVRTLIERIDPLVERAHAVAENVEFVTSAVRAETRKLSDTVNGLTVPLDRFSDRLEERVEEFNLLLMIAQKEAEDLFVDTAATVRGVRAGARALRESEGPEAPPE